MRTYIIPGHRVTSGADFSLNDLSGSTGRLDVLLRSINAAFFLSNGFRQDAELYLVLLGQPDPPKALKFVGAEMRYLNPDERSTAALVRTALLRKCGGEWVNSTPGIYVARKDFAQVLSEAAGDRPLIYLRENGPDARGALAGIKDPAIVLGDQLDLTPEEESLVASKNAVKVSIGPRSLHTDHCITVINNELDRLGI